MEATQTTRAAAGYRAGTGYRRCWNCEHFTLPGAQGRPEGEPGGTGTTTCAVLGGPVEPTAVCDRWGQMADRARKRTGFRSALRRHGGGFLWDEEPGRGGPAGGAPPAGI